MSFVAYFSLLKAVRHNRESNGRCLLKILF